MNFSYANFCLTNKDFIIMVYTEVESKDFKRVQKLIDTNDDGSKMCRLIKDPSKAIRRYVAGRILTGEGVLSIEDYRKKNFGKFASFANRAIELNATYFDIIVTFIKNDDIDIIVDWIIDEYLNEDQVYDLMMYKNKKGMNNKSSIFNYIINNYIKNEDRERLACDIAKIFL